MLLFIEMTFVVLLVAVLFMIYRREILLSKRSGRTASLEEYWSGKERRRHIRFRKSLDVGYEVVKKARMKNNGRTVDVSEGGLKILIGEKLAKGAILDLIVELPEIGRPAKVEVEVVWSEETKAPDADGRRMFYSGVKFLAIREPVDSSLVSYIRSLPSSSAV